MTTRHNIASVIGLSGMTQKELAKHLGVSYQMVSMYKTGNFTDIGHSKALIISELAGVPVTEIDFTPEGNKRRK